MNQRWTQAGHPGVEYRSLFESNLGCTAGPTGNQLIN